MGGTLRYKSAPGVGTTATVVVPLEGVTATISPKDLAKPVTRNLSEELATLFDPQCRTPSASAEPEDRPSITEASKRLENEERTGSLAQGAKKTLVSGLPGDKPADSSAAQQASSPARVLVVDDNPIARRILVTFLKTKKVTFSEASGGAQAIERFKEFRPNLVWCDIQMPDVDGVQATREMREYERQEDLCPARIVRPVVLFPVQLVAVTWTDAASSSRAGRHLGPRQHPRRPPFRHDVGPECVPSLSRRRCLHPRRRADSRSPSSRSRSLARQVGLEPASARRRPRRLHQKARREQARRRGRSARGVGGRQRRQRLVEPLALYLSPSSLLVSAYTPSLFYSFLAPTSVAATPSHPPARIRSSRIVSLPLSLLGPCCSTVQLSITRSSSSRAFSF